MNAMTSNSASTQSSEAAAIERHQWEALESGIATDHNGVAEVQLLLENIRCSSCVELIEKQFTTRTEVLSLAIDGQTGRSTLRWKPTQCALSTLLLHLVELGFHPHIVQHKSVSLHLKRERNELLKRIAVAGVGMMQVMTYAIGTYFGASQGMQPEIERLLFFVAMLVATPVVFYSGAPFLKGAWLSLRAGQPSMDVPVALALLLAYSASCINYFRADGSMYFESATMFIFLLLLSRLITLHVKHRSIDASLALVSMLPGTVTRVTNNKDECVPLAVVVTGDLIRAKPGETIAADGIIIQGQTTVDESLLTGESSPHARAMGDTVIAGSINCDGTFLYQVTAAASSSRIAQITDLLIRTQQQKTPRVQLANRVASYFISAVLLLACAVYTTWLYFDADRAFSATLSVLVVTCPCALALAIPAALSAGATQLARTGLLVSNLESIAILPSITHVLFDKTGTLSAGKPVIKNVTINSAHPKSLSTKTFLEYIAALEKHSSHPLATAFAHITPAQEASNVKVTIGRGLQGKIEERWIKIGSAQFIGDDALGSAAVHMSDQDGWLGSIDLVDPWREDAGEVIQAFHAQGVETLIVSGDAQERVDHAVTELGLRHGEGSLQSDEKLDRLRRLQANGEVVLAIGDGVNDAALLAGADVSVALNDGADLAQAGADIVLTSNRLHALTHLIGSAQRVRRVVRQNLAWAIAYNLIAVPLAALGLIGPGLAALGMSVSSLVVVTNAARLVRTPTHAADEQYSGVSQPPHHLIDSHSAKSGAI